MNDAVPNQTRAGSTAGIERASGRAWTDWMELFETRGARHLAHLDIARLARSEMPEGVTNPDWWAQAAAIAYEQEAGLRVPGQSSTGTFRVGASRTLKSDRDAAIESWAILVNETLEHRGYTCEKIRQSRTDKRSFWRANLSGAGRIEVAAAPKGDDRVTLALSHEGLETQEEIEPWRAYWKAWLQRL